MCYVFVKEVGVAKYACAALSSMAEAEGKKMIKQLAVCNCDYINSHTDISETFTKLDNFVHA